MKTLDFKEENISEIVSTIKSGKVCFLPSDTLYGFSCLAEDKSAVEKIYSLKERENNKPFIILVPNLETIKELGISISQELRAFLTSVWPAPLTAVFPTNNKDLTFLHRGTNSLGIRMPNNKLLLDILKQTGPITSTTANISGERPCETVEEAQTIFGEKVDLYVENGKMISEPSTVVSFVEWPPKVVRNGVVKIPEKLLSQSYN